MNIFTCCISGFANSVDLLFAEIVAERIAKNPPLKLVAVIPYRKRLDTLQKAERTKALINRCAEIYVAAEEYHPSVYAKRTRYMVERSDRVIAVYNGREIGGTIRTIRLAHSMKKELREIAIGEIIYTRIFEKVAHNQRLAEKTHFVYNNSNRLNEEV